MKRKKVGCRHVDENGQDVGPNSSKFNNLIGTLANSKNVLPLTSFNCRFVVKECKDNARTILSYDYA